MTQDPCTMPLGVTAVMLPELDFDEQVELCRSLGVTHYSLRPRVISDKAREQPYSNWGNHRFDLTPARLVAEADDLRAKLTAAGLTPFGTVPALTTASSDDEIRQGLEGAAKVGAGRMRLNPAPYPGQPFDCEAYLDTTCQQYRKVVDWAQPLGIKLVMETHTHSSVTSPALAYLVCRAFDPTEVGVIFDLPNFAREGNLQPHLAVSVIGRYIDHVHIGAARRVAGDYDPNGYRKATDQFCPMTEGDLYLPAWISALRDARIHVPLIIEDFTPGVPGCLRLAGAVRDLGRLLDHLGIVWR